MTAISVNLCIWGIDPDVCTARIGLTPSYAVRKGEPGRWLKEARHTSWSIELTEDVDALDDLLTVLLDRLWPKRQEILALLEEDHAEADFSVHFQPSAARPMVDLGPQTLRRLAYFGLEISLDLESVWPSVLDPDSDLQPLAPVLRMLDGMDPHWIDPEPEEESEGE